VNLAEIAAQTNLSETLQTKELIDKKFTINNVKKVNGMYGETFVGDLTLHGPKGGRKNIEAWLSGSKVFVQIEAMLENDDLPRENLTMTREKNSYGEPFVLSDA
tara:strand:- start:47 stop:358 length:312 start_codon:yes stop_codon:yes gene_type:complete